MADPKDCKGALSAAVKGAFSQEDIDAIADRMTAKRAQLRAETPALGEREAIKQAAASLEVSAVKAALKSRRAEIYARLAQKPRLANYEAMGGTLSQKLNATTVGEDKAGFGGRASVDHRQRAYDTELIGDLERGLRQAGVFGRATGAARDSAWEKNVAIEMARENGGADIKATGDEAAVKAAEVLVPIIEKGRLMQNSVGAWIGKLDGYITRQNHDAMKIAGGFWRELREIKPGVGFKQAAELAQVKARTGWVNDQLRLLDEKSYPEDLAYSAGRWKGDGADPLADKRKWLEAGWYNLITGDHGSPSGRSDIEGFLPKTGKAAKVSAERVYHYKSPEAWWEYQEKYGKPGGLFAAVKTDLEGAARATGLMEVFGPNPDVAWQNDLDRFSQAARTASDSNEGKRIRGGRVQSGYDVVSGAGERPENLRLAYAADLLQQHEMVSKLGAMVLSKFNDFAVAPFHLQRWGVDFLDSYGAPLHGVFGQSFRDFAQGLKLEPEDAQHVGELLDVGSRATAGHLQAGMNKDSGARGVYTYLGRMNYMLQGFNSINEGVRAGVAVMLAHHLGRYADTAFDALPQAVRDMFGRYGVSSEGWGHIAKGAMELDGKRLITFDGITHPEAKLRYRMMLNDLMDNATSEARGQERRNIAQFGLKRGTALGEAMRLFLQFKSFFLTLTNRTVLPAVGMAARGEVAPLASLVLGSILLGYASLQAKELVKGRTPRPLSLQTGIASLVQGGGLGIYGDFLFGERNRMGGGALETFGGPALGDLWSVTKLYDDIRQGGTAPGAVGNSAFRLVKGEIPFANLWYARAALDYLVFWRAEEAIDPGWASRYQANVERQNHAAFWLKPTEAVQ